MKQSLQLRLGQQLTMTPQLQQAIRLLQLSTLDLQTEIQQAIETNPMLELDEEDSEAKSHENAMEFNSEELSTHEAVDRTPDEIDLQAPNIPDELPIDTAWEDIYDIPAPTATSRSHDEQEDREFLVQDTAPQDLRQHLLWQMSLAPFTETDQLIATAIIDAINEDGYLVAPLDELCASLRSEIDVEPEEIQAVLHRIQHFEPVGVGARDIPENLLIQLQEYPPHTLWLDEAKRLIGQYLKLLGERDYTQLMRRMKLSEEELRQVITLIQSLNPRPGSQITASAPQYIIPDVFVSKVKGRWHVELNPDIAPRLRINSYYASLIRRADSSADNSYLRNHLQEARWFLKSLQSRNMTLLKVASCIVEHQRAFLDYGEEAMKPLVLHDIAEALDMHESTISRVTTQKFMHTHRGVFELKYFFSSHVSTANGGTCSSTAIRALIKKLVEAENPSKPLSDNKIANILSQQGIKVARRTVAKYREAMAIAPSNERKRLV